MTADLVPLLGTREGPALEFKRSARDRDAVRKAICAFANDLAGVGGGDLLIGVGDDGTPSDTAGADNDYRNPSLASAMKTLGYVNRFGRGIGRIRVSMRSNGNPPPVFVVDDASWTVILPSAA